MYRWSNLAVVLAFGLAITGCEQAKSANPLSPSVAGPIPGVNITAPQTLDPPAGAELVQQGQPVSLIIQNATTTGERPLWLQVQLAGDPSFSTLLHHADRISPGEGGRTTYRIPEALGSGYTYYWRARALDGANTGPYSEPTSFKVVEPVVIDAPVPLEPVGNITTITPVFKLRNGRLIGATNAVYRIEVGTAPDPSSIVAVLTAAPDPSGTTSIAVGNVPYATTYYWRVYATDGTITSPYSAVVSFRTPNSPHWWRRRNRRRRWWHAAEAERVAEARAEAAAPRTRPRAVWRYPATAPASSVTWRLRIPAHSATRARNTVARGSSWTAWWIACGRSTRAGATTGSAATRVTRRWTWSITTSAARTTRAPPMSTSST